MVDDKAPNIGCQLPLFPVRLRLNICSDAVPVDLSWAAVYFYYFCVDSEAKIVFFQTLQRSVSCFLPHQYWQIEA